MQDAIGSIPRTDTHTKKFKVDSNIYRNTVYDKDDVSILEKTVLWFALVSPYKATKLHVLIGKVLGRLPDHGSVTGLRLVPWLV